MAEFRGKSECPGGDSEHYPWREGQTGRITSLKDKRLGRLVRNNMAASLLVQENKNPNLYKIFMEVIKDESETDDWRLYSVQHLAFSLPFSAEPQAIVDTLVDLADSAGPLLSGQALLMLNIVEEDGRVQVDGFEGTLLDKLKDRETTTEAKISIIGLIGKRKMTGSLQEIRKVASTPSDTQRVAIATLGLIGNESDIPLVETYINDSNYLVAAAAKGALKRLEALSKQSD